jgi:hypothetical protein
MWKKYKIQKIITKISKESILQYLNNLCEINVNSSEAN